MAWGDRSRLKSGWTVGAFGVFLLACCLTHALNLFVLASPASWMSVDSGLISALALLVVAIAFPSIVPRIEALIQSAQASRSNELRFLAASESSNDGFYILESVRDEAGELVDFRFEFANDRGATLVSSTPALVRGKRLCEMFPLYRTSGHFDQFKRVVETGVRLEEEISLAVDGINASWIHHQVVKLGDGIAVTSTDVTRRKENELKLARTVQFTESTLSSSPFATIVTDLHGTITAMNPAAERMVGYRRTDLIHRQTPLILLDSAELARRALQLSEALETTVEPGMAVLRLKPLRGEVEEAEWKFIRKDGSRFDAQLTVSGLADEHGHVAGLILIAYDITERKRTEDYVAHVAHHDALTGVPTRNLFHDRLKQSMARANRNRHKSAILMIDLDHFKKINDRLGHHAGDELLVEVAKRLKASVRASDTVARMGGDEFVVLLDEVGSTVDAELVAAKLLELLQTPLDVDGEVIIPSASVGICLYPDDGANSDALLKNADAAMYQAKQRGRNNFHTFTEDLAKASSRRRALETGLDQALALHELELVYQPQVSLITGRVDGVEALLRWKSNKLGFVSPAEFIPVAEENGLIVPIGEWVLRTACRQGRKLQRELGRDITIAVNVSPRQFHQDKLPCLIRELLEETGMPAGSLELEITENILISDSATAMTVLEEVRAMGVRVAIDDFGTGFSSMSYIMRFRVDRLKIDQSFIRDMTTDPDSSAVTMAVIALARGLKIPVIAEGVETAAHRELLASQGCDEAQGYFYSRPVAFNALMNVIETVESELIAA